MNTRQWDRTANSLLTSDPLRDKMCVHVAACVSVYIMHADMYGRLRSLRRPKQLHANCTDHRLFEPIQALSSSTPLNTVHLSAEFRSGCPFCPSQEELQLQATASRQGGLHESRRKKLQRPCTAKTGNLGPISAWPPGRPSHTQDRSRARKSLPPVSGINMPVQNPKYLLPDY